MPAPFSRPAAVWSVAGAILYPLLALFGVFPTVSDLCWSCVPAAPGQDLLVALTLVSVVAVPVSTVILLLAARRPGGRWPAVVLLGTGLLTLVELVLASLGFTRFGYLFVAAGPAALVGLGGFLFLWPRLGRRAGAVCSLAAAALVIAWFAGSSAINTLGFDAGLALGSIPAGLLLPLAIAWEGDRAVRLSSPPQPVADEPAAQPSNTIDAGGLDTPSADPRLSRSADTAGESSKAGAHRFRAPAFVRSATLTTHRAAMRRPGRVDRRWSAHSARAAIALRPLIGRRPSPQCWDAAAATAAKCTRRHPQVRWGDRSDRRRCARGEHSTRTGRARAASHRARCARGAADLH